MKTKLHRITASFLVLATISLFSACHKNSPKEVAQSLPQEVLQSQVTTYQSQNLLTVSEFLSGLTGTVKSEETDHGYIFRQTAIDAVTKAKTEASYVFDKVADQKDTFFVSRVVINGEDVPQLYIYQILMQFKSATNGTPQ
jgi:hypothetical protein